MTSESGVPELPSYIKMPMRVGFDMCNNIWLVDSTPDRVEVSLPVRFTVELINSVYTPGGLRDRLEKAEERVKELEANK